MIFAVREKGRTALAAQRKACQQWGVNRVQFPDVWTPLAEFGDWSYTAMQFGTLSILQKPITEACGESLTTPAKGPLVRSEKRPILIIIFSVRKKALPGTGGTMQGLSASGRRQSAVPRCLDTAGRIWGMVVHSDAVRHIINSAKADHRSLWGVFDHTRVGTIGEK